MISTLETLDDNKIKLSVTIDEAEFEPDLDAAYKRIAQEVRMPGFRPGKVPRKLLEKQLGPGAAREEALRVAMPGYYSKAVVENDVDVIAAPEIEVTAGHQDGDVVFDAVVEVRPVVAITGHDGMTIEIGSPIVTDQDVQDRLDSIRRQHASLEVVEREAADGDHVTIDIAGTIDGEPVPGLTADGYDYVVGSGAVVPEVDENLVGVGAGDTVEFSADHPNDDDVESIDFVITVSEVQEQILPEATDEFAADASEFDTITELREDLTERIQSVKRAQAAQQFEDKTGEALAALVADELSEALLEDEVQNRGQDLAMRLQSQGMELEQYLQITGMTPEVFRDQLREQAEVSVRVDLALRAVAEIEDVAVTDEALDEELTVLATQLDQPLDKIREQLAQNGRLKAIRSDMRIRSALQWVMDRADVVDEDGNPIDRNLLEPEEHDHADHEGSEEE